MSRSPLYLCLLAACMPAAVRAQSSNLYDSLAKEGEAVMLEPIVVITGDRSRQEAFNNSSSVRVFNGDNIDRGGQARSASDLVKQTVNTVDLGSGNDLPTVRGVDGSGPAVGAVAFLAGTRPRLNLSIDGRSATYNEYAFGTQSLWDMAQVEVLRGAQSHIQGQNAIAGAIVMRSNDPTHHWEAATKLAAGNHNSRQAAVMLSGPIVKDELAFRFSADHQRRDSHIQLPAYDPAGNPRKIESTTARFKLRYSPSANPDFSTSLTLNHIDARAPQNETRTNPQSRRYSAERPVFETGSTAGIWDVVWHINPQWSLESTLVHSHYRNDRLSLPAPRGVPAKLRGREWQWEPVLRYEAANGALRGLAGLHYFSATQDESVDVLGQRNHFDDKNTVHAAFAEGTWSPSPAWDFTLGARLEREAHRRDGGSSVLALHLDKAQTVLLPKLDIAYKPHEQLVSGFKIARGYNPGGAGITFGRPVVSYSYEPEYVNNYELYTRYRLPERNLDLAANLFFNDYKNMQLPFYLGENSVVIRNADKVHTWGLEASANWQATETLELSAAAGLLQSRIRRYPGSGIEGHKLGRAPSYTANLGLAYQLPSGWKLGGDVRFVGPYFSAANNAAVGKIDAYRQVNLHAAYAFKNGEISVYADNIFNSQKDIFIPVADRRESLTQRPRALGVAFKYHFAP